MAAGRVQRWGCLLAFAFVACGGVAPRAEAPDEQPRTVEEAETRIDVAKRLIQATTTLPQTAKPTEPTNPPSTPASPKGVGAEPGWGANTDVAPRESARGASCDTSCRAIVSMRRAVAVLCRLTGEDDPRCVDAKHTLSESERRVVACGCGNT